MTLPFLQTFTRDFSPAQRQALEDLAARAAENRSLGEDEIQALIAKVEEGVKPLFDAPEFGAEIVDGCKISTALESVRADLTTLLEQAQSIESVSVRHESVHRSLVNKLHQAVIRLDELILTNKTRRLNPDYTDVKFIDFYTARNDATSPNRGVVENDTGQLVSSRAVDNRYMTRSGELRAKLFSEVISTGINPDANRTLLPDDASRRGNNYVWGEVLLGDAPMTGRYNFVDYDGAVVRLDVELPQSEDINEIKLAPWGRYPLKLIAVEYFDGDTVQPVPGVSLPMTLELDTTAIRFDPVHARKIRLVFHQPQYRFERYAFERGQIKRSSFLNVMLERSLKDTINDQGTLLHELQDDRRETAKRALDKQLGLLTQTEPLDRYRQAINDITAVDDDNLVVLSKYEYVVGLRQLEVNYRRYRIASEYQSQPIQAVGSVFEFQLYTDEDHVELSDGGINFDATCTEWSVDMGDGRIVDILPEDADVITEVLDFDATLTATTRFIEDHTASIREVFRDGELLTGGGTNYTASGVSAGNPIDISIEPAAWRVGSIYVIKYRPIDTEKTINVLDLYDSIKPIEPEVFQRTGENNRISLRAHPFVLPEIAVDNRRWTKPDPFDAGWVYRGPNTRALTTDPKYVVRVDGENFGNSPLSLELQSAALAADTTLDCTDNRGVSNQMGLAVATVGVVRINDELIYYDGLAGYSPNINDFDLLNCVRGYDNTVAADHAMGDTVEWVTRAVYYPVYVEIDGKAARNVTDYTTGRNPAFSDTSGIPQFVQIGNSLYFDRPIQGRIEVWYRRLVDKMVVRANLRSHIPGQEFTPIVNRYALKMKTATL